MIHGLLALGAALAWRASAGTRARLQTRALLRDVAARVPLITPEVPPGPLPQDDAWGQALEYWITPLGRQIASAGPDRAFATGDDLIEAIDTTALGDALAQNAARVRQGDPVDHEDLRQAAQFTLGEPVSLEMAETLRFVSARGDVLAEVSFTALGEPRHAGGRWQPHPP